MCSQLKAVSFGGGVQSTALLVLAAQGKIDYKTFLFCNVGDDSEHPATLDYVHNVAMPYAAQHGMVIEELQRHNKEGEKMTLYSHITRPNTKSIGIPVRMANGAPGNRECTGDFKIKVIIKWLKAHGATAEHPALVALGISLDEFQRMRSESGFPCEKLDYPLIEMRLDRAQCMTIIADAGIPVPPKSSCWFCPYHRLTSWQEMRTKEPALFEKALELEAIFNARREALGKDHVYFHHRLKPLKELTTDMVQTSLFEDDFCDSGYCFL